MTFEVVSAKFKSFMEKARRNCEAYGYSDQDRQYALLAVCAWADEKILGPGFEWREKQKWQLSKLQKNYCGTDKAGALFFDNLATIHKQKALPESQKNYNEKELRQVYDYCLSMGFKGKYTTPEEEHLLNNVIAENRQHMNSSDESTSEKLFPEAYKGTTKKMPSVFSKYSWLILAVPAIVLILIYLIYQLDLNSLYSSYYKF